MVQRYTYINDFGSKCYSACLVVVCCSFLCSWDDKLGSPYMMVGNWFLGEVLIIVFIKFVPWGEP